MRSVVPVLIAGTCVGLLLGLLAVGFAGAGHGTYIPAKLLFPYSMSLAMVTGEISTALIAFALLQYPAYALAFYPSKMTISRWKVAGVIAALHIIAVITAVVSADPSFAS